MALVEHLTRTFWGGEGFTSTPTMRLTEIAVAPRGSRLVLEKVTLSATPQPDLLGIDNLIMAIVRDLGLAGAWTSSETQNKLESNMLYFEEVYVGFEAGATDTANVVLAPPRIKMEIIPSRRHRAITSKGAASNVRQGWAMVDVSPLGGSAMTVKVFMHAEYRIEWLRDGRPSPNLGWVNDEEENQ